MLVLLCGTILAGLKLKGEQETFVMPVVLFLNEQMSSDFMKADVDGACANLSSVNLYALNVPSHEACLRKWSDSCLTFSEGEKNKLHAAIEIVIRTIEDKIADKKLKKQLQALPWQFGKTVHPYYLDGLPHTRGDIVWLTDKLLSQYDTRRLARLLMHERMHIWQRKHPKHMQQWMEQQGFKPLMKQSDYSARDVIRFNPDVNDTLYLDANGKIMIATYRSLTPSGLLDVQYSSDNKGEHPYETFAYSMETLVD